MIYLPATAQVQLFAGIDALSAPRSHVAVEESVPMDATPLPDYLKAQGRPVPSPESDAGTMTGAISMVSAIKG